MRGDDDVIRLDGVTGTVTVAGRRIDALSGSRLARFRARHIGIIFQFFNLLDDLTVEDNVLLPAQLAGVTAASGPFATSAVQVQWDGEPFGQLDLAGRSSGGGPVDDVVPNAGHWAGVPPSAQLLYRFSRAPSQAEVRADVAEVSRALPPDAVTGAASWLAAEDAATGNGAIMEPFVVAFALIGLGMAVLIAGNVVSGAVVAGYRRIGVLKCIGLAAGDTATVITGSSAQVRVRIVGEVFHPGDEPVLYGGSGSLPGVAIPANLQSYDAALRPGTSAGAYVQAVNGDLGSGSPWRATTEHSGGHFHTIASALVGLLALMVAVAA